MIPTLDIEENQNREKFEDEEYFVDDHREGDVLYLNSTSSFINNEVNLIGEANIPLAQLYAQREQEMIKAVEFGQNLLKRVRYLENQLSLEKTEKDEYQKAKGYLEEENEMLKHRVESMEQLIDDSRKDRNKLQYTCKEMSQEIEKLQHEAQEKESLMEKYTHVKEQSTEYKYKIEDLKEIILQYEEKEKNEEKKVDLLRRNSEKSEKTETDYLKKQINDLQQKMEKYQAERDMAHVQARVRINELKQGMDELQENEKRLKEMLEKKQPPSKIKKAHTNATECNREIRNFRTQFLKDSASISQCFDELASVLSGMTGLVSEKSSSKINDNDTSSLEMSYAILQNKIIMELGLDEFFGGKNRAHVTKKGWLRITTSYFDNKDKWVKVSNSGICIYANDSEKILLSCFSLENATLKISSRNTSIFEILCDIGKERKKVIHVTTKNENERNEWCAFISRTLEIIT